MATLLRENGNAVKILSVVILVYQSKYTILHIVFAAEASPASGPCKEIVVLDDISTDEIRIEEDRFGFEPE